MTDPAKTNAAPADAAGAVDEFAHIPRSATRHPLIAVGGAVLALYLIFHLRHDLRYALSAGEPERRLATAELAAVHTMAPVVIPDDAYLLVEGDRPREHASTILLALILAVFAAVNVVGLVRNRR